MNNGKPKSTMSLKFTPAMFRIRLLQVITITSECIFSIAKLTKMVTLQSTSLNEKKI